jgi:hypothetical protein
MMVKKKVGISNIDTLMLNLDWLLFNVTSAIFSATCTVYHGGNKLFFNEMMLDFYSANE